MADRVGGPLDTVPSLSGRPIARVYTPADVADLDYGRDLGDPGTFPFTRGLHPTGYLGKRWTMRQFAGFGTPVETNARYRELLTDGGTGLSVAFDLPTLMGRDADHPSAAGEVGRCGVSVATVADLDTLFAGIDLGRISTSMTINAPAAMMFAAFLVLAERRGVAWADLSGTLQNDILKEFIAQKEFIYPPRASMRLVTDVIAFAAAHTPRWHPISISGYHIREAGATASQELAMTLGNGIEYVEWGRRAGLAVDDFAPRLSFFFNAERDLFEEVAKFRAARRLWARIMRDRFGATNPKSWQLRCHAQTAGASLTAQQPQVNVVRTALQALAAVLGGTNSLHANGLDEALGLPTAASARLALRTQQVLALETGVADVVDPLGGSWYLERLTADLEQEASAYIAGIDAMGGMVQAVEQGLPQADIARSAYRYQQRVDRGEIAVVGINLAVDHDEATPVPAQQIDGDAERSRVEQLRRHRAARSQADVDRTIQQIRLTAEGTGNMMPCLIDAARAGATLGEMCEALRMAWGEYVEPPSI